MPTKQVLEVGQIVWLETTLRLGCNVKFEDEPEKMRVHEANKTTAYIWYDEADTSSRVRYKVNQKTHAVKYAIPDGRSYRLWLSYEDYKKNVAYEKEMIQLKKQAHELVNNMTMEQLQELISQ